MFDTRLGMGRLLGVAAQPLARARVWAEVNIWLDTNRWPRWAGIAPHADRPHSLNLAP
jgi:hypothetical protein